MTVATKCFDILERANRPISSKELAKIIGNRQTRGSIESVLYKYVPSGCLKKIEYDCYNGSKTAWVFIKHPGKPTRRPKSSKKQTNIEIILNYMKKSRKPVTSEELSRLIIYDGINKQAKVFDLLEPYIDSGHVMKIPYRWGKYGKFGFVLVKMPKL